jgi:hypothetical protein
MSPAQAAALAIRLFAIWLAIYWARWAPYLYNQARESEESTETVIFLGVTGLAVLFVLFLWFFPRTVARTLLPAHDSAPVANASPDVWLAVGYTLLGLWVLTRAVPAFVQDIYVLVYAQREHVAPPERWEAALIYQVVELVIGVWLLLGAAGARRVFWWARGRGEQ